jgi:hypothetical protein
MTGADRQWAGQYEAGGRDSLLAWKQSLRASKPGEYARVSQVDPKENPYNDRARGREHGTPTIRDASLGVSVHREKPEHEFSKGDRIQFTAPSTRTAKVANRELGTIERVSSRGNLSIRLDSGREVRFNIREHAHLDHGYAVTSHSSQGQTAERVLIHVDTEKSELLVNNRFAYVSVSRAQHDAQIYTNDGSKLSHSLSRESSQRTAVQLEQQPAAAPKTEPVSLRGVRPSEEERGHTLGIGLVMISDIGDLGRPEHQREYRRQTRAQCINQPTSADGYHALAAERGADFDTLISLGCRYPCPCSFTWLLCS